MRRFITITCTLMLCLATHAQRITASFQGTPLPDVLEPYLPTHTIFVLNNAVQVATENTVNWYEQDKLNLAKLRENKAHKVTGHSFQSIQKRDTE